MIHVFNGCLEICALPAKACATCGECCGEACSGCTERLDQPLALYVVVGMLASLAELICCVMAFQDPLSHCELPEGFPHQVGACGWVKVQMGCAFLNFMFPLYVQHQLMRAIAHRQQSGAMSQKDVKESFQEVFLEDFGVCLYVFAWVASLVWSVLGVSWLHHTGCDPSGWGRGAAFLGIAFFWGLLFYSMAWYCYTTCVSATPVQWAMRVHSEVKGSSPLRGAGQGHPMAPAAAAAALPRSGCAKALTAGQLLKLAACLGLDLMGDSTYFVPGAGEAADLAYAPIQSIALIMLFQSRSMAGLGFLEEILPFTDFIPTATLAWFIDTFAAETCFGRALGFGDRSRGTSESSDSD
ncbi:unnamed protein product [Effrenium voratum]|uniref:Uncharacterized protein n=1 Tax=Effrenium voratum TaxID=2562239 RepID=A0AA36I2X3_9DINO|nr:unnamed protein product [Effrenium voratum]